MGADSPRTGLVVRALAILLLPFVAGWEALRTLIPWIWKSLLLAGRAIGMAIGASWKRLVLVLRLMLRGLASAIRAAWVRVVPLLRAGFQAVRSVVATVYRLLSALLRRAGLLVRAIFHVLLAALKAASVRLLIPIRIIFRALVPVLRLMGARVLAVLRIALRAFFSVIVRLARGMLRLLLTTWQVMAPPLAAAVRAMRASMRLALQGIGRAVERIRQGWYVLLDLLTPVFQFGWRSIVLAASSAKTALQFVLRVSSIGFFRVVDVVWAAARLASIPVRSRVHALEEVILKSLRILWVAIKIATRPIRFVGQALKASFAAALAVLTVAVKLVGIPVLYAARALHAALRRALALLRPVLFVSRRLFTAVRLALQSSARSVRAGFRSARALLSSIRVELRRRLHRGTPLAGPARRVPSPDGEAALAAKPGNTPRAARTREQAPTRRRDDSRLLSMRFTVTPGFYNSAEVPALLNSARVMGGFTKIGPLDRLIVSLPELAKPFFLSEYRRLVDKYNLAAEAKRVSPVARDPVSARNRGRPAEVASPR